MQYIVIFEDNPAADPDIRARHMSAHLAFLTENRDRITDAGPLSRDGKVWGGLWLVEALDEAEVQKLIEADPLWPTGLRDTQRVAAWRKVFADAAVV